MRNKKKLKCPFTDKNCLLECVGSCLFAEVLRNTTIGILIIDMAEADLIFYNNYVENIFAEQDLPVTLDTIKTYFQIEDAFLYPFETISTNRRVTCCNKIIGLSLYLTNERFMIILSKDITDKARLESIQRAINYNDNLGFIFSGIRHELGNPANSIKTTATVLKNNFDKFEDEKRVEYIDRILNDIKRIEYLLNSLRNFNMYENLQLNPVNLNSFFDEMIRLTHIDLERKNIKLEFELDESFKFVLADQHALHEIFLNLLTNAIVALEQSEDPRIKITSKKNGTYGFIVFEDNGCGIADDFIPYLFKPFATSKPNGTGLGLVIIQKLVSEMKGTITIDTKLGKGTSVTVALPTVELVEDQTPAFGIPTT